MKNKIIDKRNGPKKKDRRRLVEIHEHVQIMIFFVNPVEIIFIFGLIIKLDRNI